MDTDQDDRLQDDRLRAFLKSEPAQVASNLKRPAAIVSRLTPQKVRLPARTAVTRLIAPISHKRLDKRVQDLTASGGDLLLHVGCGTEYKDGFVNIDLIGARVDVPLDLAQGIPLPDGSVDGIFHEHVLEHLPIRVGYGFMEECRRVLKPGGVLRVAVPDAGACIDSYSGKAGPEWAESQPVPLMAIEDLFYGHQHVAMYDSTKLTALLRVSGFREVAERGYRETALSIAPDTEKRRGGTLYVEGVR